MKNDQFTLSEQMVGVGGGHRLYVQEWGSNSPDAKQIVFLHGGPGSGSTDRWKTLFNPSRQRVIFFDQRGCGRSLPYGNLEGNTTEDLIVDIGKVADKFGMPKFTIVGGSWGSCLALLFAIRYPERVERLVVRGIFTGRQSEVDFMEKPGGLSLAFPDAWEEFAGSVPLRFRDAPMDYLLPRVLGDNKVASKKAAFAFAKLDASVASLDDRKSPIDFESFDPVPAIIQCYYMANKLFMPDGYIMANAGRIVAPTTIVQGRYDMICPSFTAYELSKKIPNSQLIWTIAGHTGLDRGNFDAVRAALGS